MTPGELVTAARVPADLYPDTDVGLWQIRQLVTAHMDWEMFGFPDPGLEPGETYYCLFHRTMATLNKAYGAVVMEDTPCEVRRHLPILLHGHGRILVTGLGLGCVVRGLLTKPDVERIDVVEKSEHLFHVVGPEFSGDERVHFHLGDAETIDWPEDAYWDFAWHDLWTAAEALDALHARVLARYHPMADVQGVWGMDRKLRHLWPEQILGSSKAANRRIP